MGDDAGRRVERLLDAALSISDHHEVDAVLQQIATAASGVADATYSALALYAEDGAIETFVTHGMGPATLQALEHPPVGRGLLGALLVGAGPIRLDDLTSHPAFGGFPAHHPPMRTFLGVPVRTRRRTYGNLYVTEKRGGGPFDVDDERLLAVLASFAAGAVEGAMLLEGERRRSEAEVELVAAQARAEQQSHFLDEIIAAQEAERARVARDLHDDLGQALTSVLLALRLVDDALAADGPRVADALERSGEVRALVTDALQTARTLAFDLRPTVLDDLGLGPALRRLADETTRRQGIPVEVDLDGLDDVRLNGGIETVVYRVVQEALTNVVRHAGASVASIAVVVDGETVRAVVEDDGVGFDAAVVATSLGLRGMAERAVLAGGNLVVDAVPGTGTTVRLEVPCG